MSSPVLKGKSITGWYSRNAILNISRNIIINYTLSHDLGMLIYFMIMFILLVEVLRILNTYRTTLVYTSIVYMSPLCSLFTPETFNFLYRFLEHTQNNTQRSSKTFRTSYFKVVLSEAYIWSKEYNLITCIKKSFITSRLGYTKALKIEKKKYMEDGFTFFLS